MSILPWRLAFLAVVLSFLVLAPSAGAVDHDHLLSDPGVYGTFAVFQLDRHWWEMPGDSRATAIGEVKALVEQWGSKLLIESYLLRGLSDHGDVMFRVHSPALSDSQGFVAALLGTALGDHLVTSGLMHGLTKEANYVPAFPDRVKADLKAPSQPGAKPYAIVIPIRKDAEWWSLDQEKRTAMMQEHTEAALPYHPTVKRKLYHSTGPDDFDFITYFETAKLEDFRALILALEKVKEHRHTRRFGHPTLIGTVRPLGEILELFTR